MAYIAPLYPHLPDVSWGVGVAARTDINATASKNTQLQVAAENAPLRIIYGEARVGAQIADVLVYQSKLIIVAIWGEGPIEAISQVWMDDAALPTGVTATHYQGSDVQTVNSTLVAAYAAVGITYSDALPGIAYSVFSVSLAASTGFPSFAATIKGRKVYDPRSTLTVWSDNPSLCLADFIQSTKYGRGVAVDYSTVGAAADDDDVLVGGQKRRLIGLAIDEIAETRQWIETLRTYCGCWLALGPNGVKLLPDTGSTSEHSFTATGILKDSMQLTKTGVRETPTVVEVVYMDTSTIPWAEKSAYARAPGVLEGTTPRRESRVSLLGIKRYSQAYREAVQRLNHFTLEDLSVQFTAFDEALKIERGTIIDVTHPIGLTAKLLRATNVSSVGPGRWGIAAIEFDPATRSNVVEVEPTYSDTALPNPTEPPTPTGLVATEEVFQLENGTYSSRIKVVWDAADYAYYANSRVEVYESGNLVYTATVSDPIYRTSQVQEAKTYTIKVAFISVVGAVGTLAETLVDVFGKYLVPGNVPSVSTFEVGGTVYLSWVPAVDIDIWRYEVRRGLTTDTWDDAVLLDRVDALRLSTNLIPTGTWRVFVKALDSVGQYSATAAYSDVTVTTDANSFLVDSYDQTAPTLTNMASFSLAPADLSVYYVTEDGVAFGTKYSSTLDAYTNALATYHSSLTSTWLGESDDFGQILAGQWTGTADVSDLSGSSISYLGLSDDGSAWTYQAGLSLRDTGRFARLKHEALTTSTLLVTVPDQNIRLDAVPREEVGAGSALATGTNTVTLTNDYVAVKKLTITPTGTAARIAVYDNIVMGDPTSFDVYIFDAAGNRVACDYLYTFQGI